MRFKALILLLCISIDCTAVASQRSFLRIFKGSPLDITSIQLTDLTDLGAFSVPSELDFGSGPTYRYVGGQLRFYGVEHSAFSGDLLEYLPVAEGSLTTTGTGFSQSSVLNNFGDIFQNEIWSDVDDGGGGSLPKVGIAQTGTPNGLFWHESSSRMYWLYTTSYNNTTTHSGTAVGYSTLNDGSHTGTGIGMWKLSPPKPTGYGNRWVNGLLPIPASFASVHTGNRALGIGFGGNYSIISNGPPSIGPALFAINAPAIGTDTDHDYMATAPVQLLNYPADESRATKPFSSYQGFIDKYVGSNTSWGWAEGFPGKVAGVWINGTNKQGILFFTILSAGNVNTTISASPTPTHTVFTVNNIGDAKVGDYVRWETNTTAGNPDYKFCVGTISNITGSQVTVTNIKNAYTDADDTTGIPIVGGAFIIGSWYQGGGTAASRWVVNVTAYTPAQLGLIALGASPYGQTPYINSTLTLSGQSSSFPGGGPNSSQVGAIKGGFFNPTNKRLYLMFSNLPNRGSSLDTIYVFSVNVNI